MSKLVNATKTSKTMAVKATATYYDDIMSTDGSAIGSAITVSLPSNTSNTNCNYFASKRMGTKDQVIDIDGMDTMVINTVASRSNGIRAWETARSETYMRRQREQERRNQVHMVHKFKREHSINELKQQKESRQRQEEEDARYFEQTRREIDAPVRAIIVATAEEEDPTW
jgi:hypothetical protein